MYIPKAYEVTDLERQIQVIEQNPLGIVFTSHTPSLGQRILNYVTGSPSSAVDSQLCATHVPFVYVPESKGEKHKLVAHLSIKNNQVQHLEQADKVLVVFQGPNSYISPSWYPLKKKTHKFVPTWSFAATHVYGVPRIIRDKEWLLEQVCLMTDQEENKRPEGDQYEDKWKVSDAPEKFVWAKLDGIVGLEVEITDVQGKFKFDQDGPKANVEGIIVNLEAEHGCPRGLEVAKATKDCHERMQSKS